MKLKSTLFIVLFITGITFSQEVSLEGKVIDSKNGGSIQGAVVFISSNYMSYSNNEGFYSIKNIPSGNYVVKVSRIGYKSILTKLSITDASFTKDFSLEASPIELDEVIVNTDRSDKYLKDLPYSGIVLSKGKIEKKSFQSIPDALKDEPGISLLRDGVWGTEVSIRGLSRENVVTLIDGNRISTSTDVAARLSMVDMNDVERVEVIKGASSSIYGSGATGGIVNIVTKSPQLNDRFTLNGNVSTGYSSVNNLSTFAGSILGGGSFWSSKVSGSYRKAENTQTPAGELKNSQFEDYSFSGALNITPVANNLLKLDYQLFKAKDVGIPGASVFPENADVRYPDEKRELVSLGYEVQNISKVLYKLSASYSYQDIERNVENIPHTVQNLAASGSTPARRVSVLKITPNADHKSNNLQLQANLLLAENNNLVLGIDYWDRRYNGERQKYQLIEALNAQGSVVNTTNKIIGEKPLPDSKYKSFGIFAQDDAELIKNKLSLLVDGRFDKINVNGETTFNPIYEIVNGIINYSPSGQKVIWNKTEAENTSYSGNIGVKYAAVPNLDFTLSVGLSFRSPSLEERFQYIDQGSYVRVGKADLNPEKGKSADLGIRFYTDNIKIISSVFYNYFNDLVTEIPGKFEGRNAYIKTNIGKASIYGFDLHSDYNIYNDFVLYTTLSYVRGKDIKENSNLPEIPPLNGNVGIRFGLFDKLDADLSSTIFAAQKKVAAGELTTPGYAYFNVNLNSSQFKLGLVGLQLSAGVENLFNKEYRNHLATSRGLIKFEPGRNLYVKLNVNW